MIIPKSYEDKLDYKETEIYIKYVKDNFEANLAENLNLLRVSAPLFVKNNSGLNDNLNSVERPVSFDAKGIDENLEVVHSLAKWKRMALKRYDFKDMGIYTDMNAIRRDEEVDNLHSFYVDQWDWEKIVTKEERNLETLKDTVRKIVKTLKKTQDDLLEKCPKLEGFVSEDVFFIDSQELEDMYPDKTPKEREDLLAKEKKTICIIGIGDKLRSGKPHDLRAPDYDDWHLNCDILVYYPILDRAIELSSMGIRVDRDSLLDQLNKTNHLERLALPFHKALMNDELPLTIGGGIGQSRLCMILLNKAHIGEVQSCIWPSDTLKKAIEYNIHLL